VSISFHSVLTDVTTSEVTTLQHELRDDAVERRALVAEALLAGAESTEVLGSLGDYIIVEIEVDASSVGCRRDQELAAEP
jgi:hypothetical protein